MSQIIVGKDEMLRLPILWTGDEVELKYDIVLAEPGASVYVTGLLIGKKDHSVKVDVTVTHTAPHTTSDVRIKATLADKSHVDVNGLVTVNAGAKGSVAWLAAHTLLLSGYAKGQAVPSLEILENDVKAGHATTIGRVNDDELFYLMSRGLSRAVAQQLIVAGFVQEMITALPADLQKRALQELQS